MSNTSEGAVYALGRLSGITAYSRDCKDPVTCKFVVLLDAGTPVLIYGPVDEFPYHANLVAAFCESKAIAAAWVRKPDLVEIYDQHVEIDGGGWLSIEPFDSQLKLYGHSTAYGGFSFPQVSSLISTVDALADFSIQRDQ